MIVAAGQATLSLDISEWWALIFLILIVIITGYFSWAFRAGRAPFVGRRQVVGPARPLILNTGYAMLPAFAGSVALLILYIFALCRPSNSAATTIVALAGVVVVGFFGAWTIKEWGNPSDSRTPEWLRRERSSG